MQTKKKLVAISLMASGLIVDSACPLATGDVISPGGAHYAESWQDGGLWWTAAYYSGAAITIDAFNQYKTCGGQTYTEDEFRDETTAITRSRHWEIDYHQEGKSIVTKYVSGTSAIGWASGS